MVNGRFVCFGELLVRLSSPGFERLLQSDHLCVDYGGAEANVAVSLARFGHEVRMVSTVPNNALGRRCLERLSGQGVDVSSVLTGEGRMGLYFFEAGASARPSQVLYDRTHSAFALASPDAYAWSEVLDDAGVFHLSGITPAVGPSTTKAAAAAVQVAAEMGLQVSFDGNYRAALWQAWGEEGPPHLHHLLSCAHLAFIDERDIALILGGPPRPRAEAMQDAFRAFPSLEAIATTRREGATTTRQSLRGELYRRDGRWTSTTYALDPIVDRVGGGDAFAAGFLHGQRLGFAPPRLIEFATAASALKHSIPGDWNLVGPDEVERAMAASSPDVLR